MSSIRIVFPGPVTKDDMSALVVEVIQYILYMHGQFPFTFEEGKKYIKELQTRQSSHEVNSLEIPKEQEDFDVYMDSPCPGTKKLVPVKKKEKPCSSIKSRHLKKAEQQLVQSVLNFENYFLKLCNLLQSQEIREVVLNFGNNFRMPKLLFHIKLPARCHYSDCCENSLPFRKCRSYLIRRLIENQELCSHLQTESLFPISVMLLISSDMTITEHMEQKPFYSVPVRRKPYEIELTYKCQHHSNGVKISLENGDCDVDTFAESTNKLCLSDNALSDMKYDLWVQLKPVLKGFRDTFTPEYNSILL